LRYPKEHCREIERDGLRVEVLLSRCQPVAGLSEKIVIMGCNSRKFKKKLDQSGGLFLRMSFMRHFIYARNIRMTSCVMYPYAVALNL
jgi:hypothetical protein